MRVLDELADAVHAARGGRLPRPVVVSVTLEDHLPPAFRLNDWEKLARALGCELPPLRRDRWRWELPPGFYTVGDLARHVARARPGSVVPASPTVADWVEAQVFAGVRACLVDALNVDPDAVTRDARLRPDLNAE